MLFLKNDVELVTLYEKVKDPCCSVGFLEVTIREKDLLIKALEINSVKDEEKL